MTGSGAAVWMPYCGAAPLPGDWLSRWNPDPLVLAALALLLIAMRRAQRPALGMAAASLLFLLFVTPFCALTSALFSARVTHHVLLSAAVAPLLVLAMSRTRTKWPGSIAFWTGAQAITFWLWHEPGFYARALSSDAVYWAMQASLLGTATAFWAALRRSSQPAAIAALLATTVQMGLLGALITFAGRPLYVPHLLTTEAWGMGALEDQQLAGLIMWAPSAGLYLAAALVLAQRWLAQEERGLAS